MSPEQEPRLAQPQASPQLLEQGPPLSRVVSSSFSAVVSSGSSALSC